MSYAHNILRLHEQFNVNNNPLHNLADWDDHTNGVYLKVLSGVATNNAPGAGKRTVVLNTYNAPADVSVEAALTATYVSTYNCTLSGIVARSTGAGTTTHYLAVISGTAPGTFQLALISTVNNVNTTLASVSCNASETVRLECAGSSIKVFKGGAEVISVTNSAIPAAGKCGLRGYIEAQAAAEQQSYDDFKIYEPLKSPRRIAPGPLAGISKLASSIAA